MMKTRNTVAIETVARQCIDGYINSRAFTDVVVGVVTEIIESRVDQVILSSVRGKLDWHSLYVGTEQFIDDVVSRIKRKQL